MDYALTEEQATLVDAVQALLRNKSTVPPASRLAYYSFDAELQRALDENGFLNAGRDLGTLEAALVTLEVAAVPVVVEASASALVAPKVLPQERLAGPIALIRQRDLHLALRNLPVARTALVDLGDDVAILPVRADEVVTVDSIFAYPYGRFRSVPSLRTARHLGGAAAAALRQWWRVAIAAEFAGAAQSALTFTVDYVKQRHVFGRPVGAFQAVQHRLAQCHQIARAIRYLTLRAAWSGQMQDAHVAACYAQHHTQKLIFDLHQFNGAMGVTNEHLLHFWTYRLRALQAEAGGAYDAALEIAQSLWGAAKLPEVSGHGDPTVPPSLETLTSE